jgi:hypothetical protein
MFMGVVTVLRFVPPGGHPSPKDPQFAMSNAEANAEARVTHEYWSALVVGKWGGIFLGFHHPLPFPMPVRQEPSA